MPMTRAVPKPSPPPAPPAPPLPGQVVPVEAPVTPPEVEETAVNGQILTEVDVTSEETQPEVTDVPTNEIPPNEPAPRRRGRPRKEVAALDPDAPFRPTVTSLHATAKRTVNVGPYESFEIQAYVEAEPDPRHLTTVNLANLVALVVQQVNSTADEIGAEIKLGK